jgi:hypothetical protein
MQVGSIFIRDFMDNFTTWLRKRAPHLENFATFDPEDKFKFSGDGDVAGDYEQNLHDLIKVVNSKYQKEFTDWLAQLGEENHDEEIMDLMDKIRTDRSSTPGGVYRGGNDDKPDIVTPKADRANDPNGE